MPATILTNFVIPAKLVGAAPFILQAPASNQPSSVAGAFSYAISAPPASGLSPAQLAEIATITGNLVTITGPGSVVVTVNQAASTDAAYTAGAAQFTLAINKDLTFDPTVAPVSKHDGDNLVHELTFSQSVLATKRASSGFTQLKVSVRNVNNVGETLFTKHYTLKDVNNYLKYGTFAPMIGALELDIPPTVCTIIANTGDAAKVSVSTRENGTGKNDSDFPVSFVSIARKPSAPTLSAENVVVKLDSAGKVYLNADFKVTPVSNENVNKVFLTAVGFNGAGEPFVVSSGRRAFAAPSTSYTFEIGPGGADADLTESLLAQLSDLQADSSVTITASSEANEMDGFESSPIETLASIRLPSAVITSVKSLQNRKVTVSGTVLKGDVSSKYTIMAQAITEGQPDPTPTNWRKTNVSDVDIVESADGSSVVFSKEVTTIGGVALPEAQAIAFCVVQHNSAVLESKSILIAAGQNAPALDQAVASNVMYGVTISHLDKALTFNAGAQVIGSSGSLGFTPSFSNGALPTSGYTFSFTSTNKGEIKPASKNSGTSNTIPASYYIDLTPVAGDQYTLACDFTTSISSFIKSKIEGATELPITLDELTNTPVVKLGNVFTKVKKAKTASEVPALSSLELSTVKVNNSKKLAAYWSLDYDSEILSLEGVEVQVAAGQSGNNAFYPLAQGSASGPTTISATKLGGDTYDSVVFGALYSSSSSSPVSIAGGAEFSLRARATYLDKGSNATVLGNWKVVYSYAVPISLLAAPTNVTIAKVQSFVGKSFDVSYTIPAKETINTDAPTSWGSAWMAIPASVMVNLYDANGKVIKSGYNNYIINGQAAPQMDAYLKSSVPLQDKISFADMDLQPGNFVYAEAQATYYKLGDISNISVGSKSDRNAARAEIPFSLSVSQITLSQTPSLPVNVNGQRNVTERMGASTKLKVSAKIEDGGAPGTVVKAIMPAMYGSAVLHEHTMTYNPSTKEWEAADITPLADLNYSSKTASVVLVYAYNNNSSNITNFLFI